ncbi:MAG TPA: twin-arginine translocase TatA/TatE family subunit [Kofleriaceae bacterium]|nr:twin-arginine translocase TatA/TatE family subunit [Kofleriaceae bacterium]
MFGMGGTEILVILIVALLFLGPDKLPEAAKQISKGIRDIKKQSRVLQQTIEDDEHIGGAIRDLKSALRGEEVPIRPRPPKPPRQLIESTPQIMAATATPAPGTPAHGAGPDAPAELPPAQAPAAEPNLPADPGGPGDAIADKPALTMPPSAGEPDEAVPPLTAHDDAELAALVKPAPNTIPRQSSPSAGPAVAPPDKPESNESNESKHG